ncbi:hypothetical protein TRFO_12371 [Tritrichomonas foetus]|uniref:Ribosome control protein 1 domain-containing protein n=1 Tax=Tritrichomonas foetus TaxID=1144522 RepID=A0A1J4L1L3_9EUKA|nr:hypothetical protein TRFO_12371 [Tritrichomonas foetus]|eukprot:OHT17415.1 hypothetical protein TRFO_12371 [Tritrichomonas foetus]
MYVSGLEKLDFSYQAEIISFSKSHCGKYLGVLFRNALQIRSLTQINLPLIDSYLRDDASLRAGGFNHWIQWINSNNLVIGTQTGHLLFLYLDQNGKIIETNAIILGKIITAHSSVFGALVLATSGPNLHFISPQGDILSSLSFPLSVPVIIRQIDISDPLAVLTFSDGAAAQITLKQSDIIEQKPVSISFLPVPEISSASIGINKSCIALQTFKGSLIRISKSQEITYICDDCSLYQTTRDFLYFISLAANGTISIWSSKTGQLSKTQLDFPFLAEATNPSLITSEIDINGLRFFCATSSEAYVITFSVIDNLSPSLLFHTPTHVIIPTTNVTIAVPDDMNEIGYPLHSVAYSADQKKTAIAGRRCFAIYSENTAKWHLVKDEVNLCRALWYHHPFFLSVVFDYETPVYKLLLLSAEDFSVIDAGLLEGIFIGFDNNETHFLVATSHSISIFEITKAPKIILVKRYVSEHSFDQVLLYHNNENVAILTTDKELIELPSNNILIEGVSSATMCREIDMFLVVAHGQQFALYNQELIRIGTPSVLVDGITAYILPKEYKFKEFSLIQGEFLPQVMFHFLDQPEIVEKLLRSFLRTRNISLAVSRALDLAFDANKYDSFNIIFENLGEAKYTLLIIALFNVSPQYQNRIKALLPPVDQLLVKFPNIADQIKGVYSQ